MVPAANKKAIKQAERAAAAIKASSALKSKKIRKNVHFYSHIPIPAKPFNRPRTLRKARSPVYPINSMAKHNDRKLDEGSIIKLPVATESAMKMIEEINTLVLLVHPRATKKQIKTAIKKLYNVTCLTVNTLVRPDGLKKAYVRLTPDQEALDVANKLGII